MTKSQISAAVAAVASVILSADPRAARATDFDTVTSRVQSNLLSSAPSTSTVQGYMNSIQADGHWTDITYSSTAQTNWSPLTHVDRMESMAEIWDNPSSSLFHNATLAADLRSSMDYWFSFTANITGAPSSADNWGNPTPYSTNWFDNNIAGPQALGGAMAMAASVFTSSEQSLGQNYLLNAKKEMPKFTGQNVVDLSIVGVYSSIASGNTADMTSAFGSMGGTIFTTPFGVEGIQADHTYHIHDVQLYMGGYGTSYVNDVLQWGSVSAGTQYGFSTAQIHNVVDYLLDGTQWFIRGKTLDLTADGRQVTFTSYVGAGTGYVNAINYALALGNYRTSELQAFLARQQNTISSGQASTTQNILSGNRMFFDSEAMVQQRAAYYASVKVTSTRTSDPESGNSQGLKNLYLGDGVNLLQITGNEYLGIQPSWNWRRLPGTTVEQDSRSLKPASDWGTVHGTTNYAGGVSDGTYGATAFDYNRYNVAAKKSWFFFDNEEVALGAAINAASSVSEVDTTINQTLLTSTVSYKVSGGSVQTLATGSTVTPANLSWVYQGGIGYFFLTPVSNATIMAVSQSGTWFSLNTAASSSNVAQNIFTLYLNHGSAFTGASYSYIAVPGIALANMDSYLASLPIQVLRNDSTAQVVRNTTLDLTEAAFYSAGNFTLSAGQTVAANNPSTIMLQRQPNTLKISASSPQDAVLALNVTLAGVNLSGGSTWFDSLGNGVTGFNTPGGNMVGSTVGITLSSNGLATPTVSLTSNDQLFNSTYTATSPVALPNNTTFSVDGFSTLAFSNAVSGTASITKTGAGTLALSGTNTFTGSLFVNGGFVRATNAAALGPAATFVNSGGTLVLGANPANAITLSGGTLAFTGSPSMSGTLTAFTGTTSTIEIFDPLAPTTPINVSFTGTLLGSGNITLLNAANTTSPDAGQAFRINANNAGTFSGNITLANNVKGELFGTTSGTTSPAGTGKMILTAGDAALGGTVNTLTTTGGYSELNLRNNTAANQTYTNDVQIVGTGLAIINPLGSAAAGASVTLGKLTIGPGQQLGIYLAASSVTHPVIFQNVSLTGGTAIFSPKPSGFGAANATGADLTLGNITEQVAGSGITMAGLRTLILNGNNVFTGGLNINSGTVQIANPGALNTSTPQPVTFGAVGSSGILDLNGFNTTVSGLTVAAGATASTQIIGNSSTVANSTLAFAGGTSTFGGIIQDAISPGTQKVALSVTSGNLILTGANTFTAGTTINPAATLTLASGGSIPNTTTFTNNGNLNLQSPSTIIATLNGTSAAAIVSLNANTLTLSSAASFAGTIADAGSNATLNINANSSLGGVQVGALKLNSANVQIGSTSKVSSLALLGSTSGGTGTFDLGGNKLIVEVLSPASKASALSALQSEINYPGYSQFTSTSGQIISSALPAAFGIAVVDNAALAAPLPGFGGLSVDTNSILVAPELLGDTNLDGHVDLTDLSTLLNNFGNTTGAWTAGNFDGQASIDLTDLSDVLNNFGLAYANSSSNLRSGRAAVGTPEPASLATLALGAAALLNSRQRRREIAANA